MTKNEFLTKLKNVNLETSNELYSRWERRFYYIKEDYDPSFGYMKSASFIEDLCSGNAEFLLIDIFSILYINMIYPSKNRDLITGNIKSLLEQLNHIVKSSFDIDVYQHLDIPSKYIIIERTDTVVPVECICSKMTAIVNKTIYNLSNYGYNEEVECRLDIIMSSILIYYHFMNFNLNEILEHFTGLLYVLSKIYPRSIDVLRDSDYNYIINDKSLNIFFEDDSKEMKDLLANIIINKTENNNIKVIDTPTSVEVVEEEKIVKEEEVQEYEVSIPEPVIVEDEPINLSRFHNRQLSWLDFNDRVLDQSDDSDIPLLEKLKFLGIASNNLDEFFMVRVGSMSYKLKEGSDDVDISGMTSADEYSNIISKTKDFYEKQYGIYTKILNESSEIFSFKRYDELDETQKSIANDYFDDRIFYALTPQIIDEGKPFPRINSKTLNIAVFLTDPKKSYNLLGIIKVPNNIERLIPISDKEFIFIEDLISNNLNKLFVNKKIKKSALFRIVRNADVTLDDPDGYILNKVKETLVKREVEDVVRMEINSNAKKELVKLLQNSFNISKKEIYHVKTPIDLTFLMDFNLKDSSYSFPKFKPQISKYLVGERNLFEAIDEKDIILHHPYESFSPIIDFIQQATTDPDVVSIKQTLYRVSSDSPIMNSLIDAANNGKNVTVLLEVTARFNESSNIEWAEKLEKAGGNIIYGVPGLKTHCKLAIVIRKNKKGNLKPYIHLGTGNYNEKTAKVYTDFSLFTSNKRLCDDAINIMNMLTGFSEPDFSRLICAPINLRPKLYELVQREIDNVEKFPDKPHHITMKINSLIDKNIIEKLYEASDKGVKIDLIVRGMCLINTKLNEARNIHVRSILGRFLEHSRIYIFANAGKEEVYISSADLMERNLDRRFEIMTPIRDKSVRKDIKFSIRLMMSSHIKRYELNGFTYNRIEGKDVQKLFLNRYESIAKEFTVEKIYY